MKSNREIKAGMEIPDSGTIHAYAIIVDLNQFTPMVTRAEEFGESVAQFVSDALAGAILEIEAEGGEVIAFIGDAVLGILPEGAGVVKACFGIAKDLDRQCEYVSGMQAGHDRIWSFAPGGPSIKISVEYGTLDISTIRSRFLGKHPLLIGSTINYAARISSAGQGNRCIVGPAAAQRAFSGYALDGPKSIQGKLGEPDYSYFLLPLDDVWIEGAREAGKDTFSD